VAPPRRRSVLPASGLPARAPGQARCRMAEFSLEMEERTDCGVDPSLQTQHRIDDTRQADHRDSDRGERGGRA
jgi:hypothetical protein